MAQNPLLFTISPAELIELIRVTVKQEFNETLLEKLNVSLSSPKFYTREETAKILHISSVTLDEYRDKGFIKARCIGKRVLFAPSDIEKAVLIKK